MQNRRFLRRAGCVIAISLTAAGCTVSSSSDWAQTAPAIAPTSVGVEHVHLGAWSEQPAEDDLEG